MKYIYLSIFIVTLFTCALNMNVLGSELVYTYRKSKQLINFKEQDKLKSRYIKIAKRLAKSTIIMVWIAYETYVKYRKPNSYSMGSWLFNINIVKGKEIEIICIITITLLSVAIMIKASRARLTKEISKEKRTALKCKVKSWDETRLTQEEKEILTENELININGFEECTE